METRYVVYQGYLRKSPPEKKMASDRWQKRWFKLWSDKMLEYYKSSSDKKPLKNAIDLTRCDGVSDGVEQYNKFIKSEKLRFPFCLHLPGRLYILLAYSEDERNTWQRSICELCSLPFQDETATDFPHDWPKSKSSPNMSSNSSSNAGSDSSDLHLNSSYPISIPSTPRENRGNFIDQNIVGSGSLDDSLNYDALPPLHHSNPRFDASAYNNSFTHSSPKSNSTFSESDDSLCRNDSDVSGGLYDVPPTRGLYNTPLSHGKHHRTSLPTSSLFTSDETGEQQVYDVPPNNNNNNYDTPPQKKSSMSEIYDVPPNTSNYNIPPNTSSYDFLPSTSNYDVPPNTSNYDIPPNSTNYDVPPDTSNYDMLPPLASYDTVPPLKDSPARLKQGSTKAPQEMGYVKMNATTGAGAVNDEAYYDMGPVEKGAVDDPYMDVRSVSDGSPPKGVKEFRPIGPMLHRTLAPALCGDSGAIDSLKSSMISSAMEAAKCSAVGEMTTSFQKNVNLDDQSGGTRRHKGSQDNTVQNLTDPPTVDRKMKPAPAINRSIKPKTSTPESSPGVPR